MENSSWTEIVRAPSEPRAKPKKIIVLLDGTWNDENPNEPGDSSTNIDKMRRILDSRSDKQTVRYFRGVGNNEDNTLCGSKLGGLSGWGEQNIRNQAYYAISKNYRLGDKVFIFGFSRGAACARMLAMDLHMYGIQDELQARFVLDKTVSANYFGYLLELDQSEERKKLDVDVELLGVWDTVYAFGIPVRLLGIPFHRYDLFKSKNVAPNIKRAVHLLAIDETREPFEPTLMCPPEQRTTRIHEVWFPGVHSDVGGGYPNAMIGRITLRYMIEQLDAHCRIDNEPVDYCEEIKEALLGERITEEAVCAENGGAEIHFHGLGYKRELRVIQSLDEGGQRVCIHKSVQWLRKSSNVFSKREDGRRLFVIRTPASRHRIVYNPPNVRALPPSQIDWVE